MYQIAPRSFFDSNADGIGDLNGIRERLRYLQNIGAGTVLLGSVYASSGLDFGHDIINYVEIDPVLGSKTGFKRLLEEIHSYGTVRDILNIIHFMLYIY